LAIEHAAALVRLRRFTLNNFISEYREHYKRLTDEKIPRGFIRYERSHSLFALLGILHSTMQEESPEAAALLKFLAFIGPWRAPASMLNLSDQYYDKGAIDHILRHCTNEDLKAVLTDDAARSLAIGHLSDACLIKIIGDPVSFDFMTVHNLICQWTVETASPKEQWVLTAASVLTSYVLQSQDRYGPS